MDFFASWSAKANGLMTFVFFEGGGMDYAFLGESEFLIKMGIVAVAVVVLGIMLRMRKPAPKDRTTDDRR